MIPLVIKTKSLTNSKGMSMKLRVLSLTILSLCAYQPRASCMNQNAVKTTAVQTTINWAIYWSVSHLVNYIGHEMGNFVATQYLNLKGDAIVTPRLTVKYITNVAGREFFGRNKNGDTNTPANHLFENYGLQTIANKLYLPEVTLIDIPGDVRKVPTLPLNARAWEAGRNYYTMHEFMTKNTPEVWNLFNKLSAENDALRANNGTQSALTQSTSNALRSFSYLDSPVVEKVVADGQLIGLALLYFFVANRIAAIGFRSGMATTESLAQKVSWTKHFDNSDIAKSADVTVFRLDPFERIIASAVCTTFSHSAKFFLMNYLTKGLEYLKLHDPRYEEFTHAAWRMGDKGLWAYYGLRAQFEALGGNPKLGAFEQFTSIIRSVVMPTHAKKE